jgi:hypothetical protein
MMSSVPFKVLPPDVARSTYASPSLSVSTIAGGMIMSTQKLTADRSFEPLRVITRMNSNRKVRDPAAATAG